MKWQILNIKGEKLKDIELPASIFGLELNTGLLHSVVKAYQANRRQGTHATKTRAYVSGGGKKPFRQKGTGGARQGTNRSPLMPGGATLHGPQPRSYRQNITQRAKHQAACIALSERVRHNKLIIVDTFAADKCSTKHVVKTLGALGVQSASALLLDERKDDLLYKSARNLEKVNAHEATQVTSEQILRHENLVISENALKAIIKRFEGLN